MEEGPFLKILFFFFKKGVWEISMSCIYKLYLCFLYHVTTVTTVTGKGELGSSPWNAPCSWCRRGRSSDGHPASAFITPTP